MRWLALVMILVGCGEPLEERECREFYRGVPVYQPLEGECEEEGHFAPLNATEAQLCQSSEDFDPESACPGPDCRFLLKWSEPTTPCDTCHVVVVNEDGALHCERVEEFNSCRSVCGD